MATQKLGPRDKPARIPKTERSRLCCRWVQLDEERRDLNRDAAKLEREQTKIAAQLAGQLELEKARLLELPDYEVGLELVPGRFSPADELEKEIGAAELARRKAAVPERDKLFIREKVKASTSKSKTRRAA